MKQQDILLLNKYIEDLCQSPRPLAIFDLDSTLYNVSPRTQKIVQDFCSEEVITNQYPNEAHTLSQIPIQANDWGYLEALDRHDFVSSVRFLKKLSKFWRKYFFSNQYMDYDSAYTNASNFVNSFLSINCEVMYLTGRSKKLMLEGSIKNLTKDKFPLKNESSLVMKTNPDLLDHIFKTEYISQIKNNFDKIILFENEPKIINRVHNDHPEIKLCFINSTHSRAETLKVDIPIIEMDYSELITKN